MNVLDSIGGVIAGRGAGDRKASSDLAPLARHPGDPSPLVPNSRLLQFWDDPDFTESLGRDDGVGDELPDLDIDYPLVDFEAQSASEFSEALPFRARIDRQMPIHVPRQQVAAEAIREIPPAAPSTVPPAPAVLPGTIRAAREYNRLMSPHEKSNLATTLKAFKAAHDRRSGLTATDVPGLNESQAKGAISQLLGKKVIMPSVRRRDESKDPARKRVTYMMYVLDPEVLAASDARENEPESKGEPAAEVHATKRERPARARPARARARPKRPRHCDSGEDAALEPLTLLPAPAAAPGRGDDVAEPIAAQPLPPIQRLIARIPQVELVRRARVLLAAPPSNSSRILQKLAAAPAGSIAIVSDGEDGIRGIVGMSLREWRGGVRKLQRDIGSDAVTWKRGRLKSTYYIHVKLIPVVREYFAESQTQAPTPIIRDSKSGSVALVALQGVVDHLRLNAAHMNAFLAIAESPDGLRPRELEQIAPDADLHAPICLDWDMLTKTVADNLAAFLPPATVERPA